MIRNLLLILSIFARNVISGEFVDKRVEIVDCESSTEISGETEFTDDIKCVASGSNKFKVTKKSEIEFHSVTFSEKPADMKSQLCKKLSGDDIQIKMENKVTSIVYSKALKAKAILVGTSVEVCAASVVASDTLLANGKLVIKSIACIKKETLPELIKSLAAISIKPYYELGGYYCFLAPMLKNPIETKAKLGKKEVLLTISSYPIEDCPPCPTPTPTPKPETNATQTTAASSTGMIAGIVIAILIVVLGGIGYVMIKK